MIFLLEAVQKNYIYIILFGKKEENAQLVLNVRVISIF